MSVLFNQTNIAPGQSFYITRTEVIEGFSTLAGDLSGVNLSSFFVNPNPVVSSITVNPAGTVGNPAVMTAGRYNLSTVGAFAPVRPYPTGTYQGITTTNGLTYQDLYAKNFGALNPASTGTPGSNLLYGYQGIAGILPGGTTQGFMGWNPSNPAGTNFILSNISSINGIPPGQSQGTFTTLTGSNITMSGQLFVPQITGVSSINGELYTASLNSNWTGSNNVTVGSNGIAVIGASIPVPAGFLIPNQTYLYDIPVVLGAFAPSPTNFTLMVGARMGGQGQINYSIPLFVNASAQGWTYNLTGIAQTGTTVGTNTVDVILVQSNATGNFSLSVYAPPAGPGNPNGITLKAI